MWAKLNQEVADEVEAERLSARQSLSRALSSPRFADAQEKPLLENPGQTTGTLLRGSPRQSLSSFCGATSCSNSWASLPSDGCGDQLEEGVAEWSPSHSPDAFAMLDAEESVEPFLLEDTFEADDPQVFAFDVEANQSAGAAPTDSLNSLTTGQSTREGTESDDESPLPVSNRQLVADAFEQEAARPMFFMRAGYRGSPGSASLFWLGDQMTSWQRHDGIKSAVTGLLSGGEEQRQRSLVR